LQNASIRQAHAAVGLNQNEKNQVTLDYSATALTRCSGPGKITYHDAFPDGTPACLNGPQMMQQQPPVYKDGNAVCVAKCEELFGVGKEPPGGIENYCKTNAHVSTNFNVLFYADACSATGVFKSNFADPRREQEPIKWVEQNGTVGGTSGGGWNIKRTAGDSGNFDAGAYSDQVITHGDAWVEFEVSSVQGYAVGFSEKPADHETLVDIPFALVLNSDGTMSISQNGTLTNNVGNYAPTDRFRVHIVENNDGTQTATLSATKVDPNCQVGTQCTETPIATQTGPSPAYPLQVDASLKNTLGILMKVTLVRIQDLP